jgi:hypothetical protein
VVQTDLAEKKKKKKILEGKPAAYGVGFLIKNSVFSRGGLCQPETTIKQ